MLLVKAKSFSGRVKKIRDKHRCLNNKILFKDLPYQITFIITEINNLKNDETPNYDLYMKVLDEEIKLNKKNKKINFCWEEKINEFNKKTKEVKISRIKEKNFKILFDGYYNF